MKPQFETVHLSGHRSSFEFFKIEASAFEPFWHYHPELELTYIQNGKGLRFVGDHIGPFHNGDLVLTGENLPHHWVSENKSGEGSKKAFVIQFPKSLLKDFPECHAIMRFFDEASRGLFFPSPDPGLLRKIQALETLSPIKQLIVLLEIFDDLSETAYMPLSSVSFSKGSAFDEHQSRISKVTTYILNHYNHNISLPDIADLSQMTEPAFCRWFKQSLGKSFINYLTWIRVEKACQSLLQTDLSIAQIAFNIGFESISNFNRAFKKIKGTPPSKYRKSGTPEWSQV